MTIEVGGMVVVGLAALAAGLTLASPRFRAESGAGKILVLGPVFEAVALAMFAMEHFTAARDLMPIVPRWLPWPLFWTYFVGLALMAAAVSLIAWRCVRWSAALLALLFVIIVATVDLPNLPANLHDRIFWTLTVRELCFASGALVLAGSEWSRVTLSQVPKSETWGTRVVGKRFLAIGRRIVAIVMVFYAIEHFMFPRNVPGVPLELMTPKWIPAPVAIAYLVGMVLLLAGVGLWFRPAVRIAAAGCGIVLLLLTVFFYVPIFIGEMHTAQAVEGINYVGDTLLFAATILLAGCGSGQADSSGRQVIKSTSAGSYAT